MIICREKYFLPWKRFRNYIVDPLWRSSLEKYCYFIDQYEIWEATYLKKKKKEELNILSNDKKFFP